MNALDSASEGPSPIPKNKFSSALDDMPELDVFGDIEPEPLSKKISKVKNADKKIVYESDGETAEKYGRPSITARQQSLHRVARHHHGAYQYCLDLSAFRPKKSQKQQVHYEHNVYGRCSGLVHSARSSR